MLVLLHVLCFALMCFALHAGAAREAKLTKNSALGLSLCETMCKAECQLNNATVFYL